MRGKVSKVATSLFSNRKAGRTHAARPIKSRIAISVGGGYFCPAHAHQESCTSMLKVIPPLCCAAVADLGGFQRFPLKPPFAATVTSHEHADLLMCSLRASVR